MTTNFTKRPLYREIQDYVFIAIGMISYAIGWNIFLLPTNVTASGLPGISSIIYWATGCPVQVPYAIVNGGLLIAAWMILGKKFCVKTIYAVVVVTTITSLLAPRAESLHLLQGQPLWAAFLGAVFCGCGIGLGFSAGGSTGGTDIVAAIVNKYRDISLGRVIMICDIFIISSSYFVVHDWEKYFTVMWCSTSRHSASTKWSTVAAVPSSSSSSRRSTWRLASASTRMPTVV